MFVLDLDNWFASLQLALSGMARPIRVLSIPLSFGACICSFLWIPFGVRLYRDFFEYDEPNEPRVHRAYP